MQITTVEALVRALQDSKLFTPEQLLALSRELAQFQENLQPALKSLVERKHLTIYQLRKVVHGKAEELFLGPYLVVDKLGEGGMGRVYRARHVRVGREVALKIIRPNLLTNPIIRGRYEREVEAAGTLRHTNIVCVEDAGQVNGRYYMAMEFVDGLDLARLVRDHNKLEIPEACEYVRQAALGLQHAHENGFVHRDIKPSNIIVSGERHVPHASGPALVKILDMGLVRPMGYDDVPGAAELTSTGTVVGTPDYMAPEQAKNSSAVDPRADLYSLGCTLYFLLTAQPPFPDGTAIEKLMKHQLDPIPPVRTLRPEVPEAVAALITRLMAKKPDDRLTTAAEVSQTLASMAVYSRGVIPISPKGATPAPGVPALPPPAPAVALAQPVPQFVQNPSQSGKMRPAPVPPTENPGLSGKMRPAPTVQNPGLSGKMPPAPAMQNPGLSGRLVAPPPSRPVPVYAYPAPQFPVHPSDPTPRPLGLPPARQASLEGGSGEITSPFASLQDPPSVPLGLPATDAEEQSRPRRRPESSSKGIIIGVVVAILIAIVAVIALTKSGGKPRVPNDPGGPNTPDPHPAHPPKRVGLAPKLDRMVHLHPLSMLIPEGTGLVVVAFPGTYFTDKDTAFAKGTGPVRLSQWANKLATDTAVELPRTDRLVLSVPASAPTQYLLTTEGEYLGGNFAQSLATHPGFFSNPFVKGDSKVYAVPDHRHVVHIAVPSAPPVYALTSSLPLFEKLRPRLLLTKGAPASLDPMMFSALNVFLENAPLLYAVAGQSLELPLSENPTLKQFGIELVTLKVQIHDRMELELAVTGADAESVKKGLQKLAQGLRGEKHRWREMVAELLLHAGTADRHDSRYRWTIKASWTAEQFSTFLDHCFGQ